MDEDVEAAVEVVRGEWEEAVAAVSQKIREVEACGAPSPSSGAASDRAKEKAALPRLQSAAQDRLSALQSLIMRMEFIAQQLPSEEESEESLETVQKWKDQYQALRLNLRSATVNAKSNMEKAAKEDRELLLGGGEGATLRRRNLQTQAGMISATENITDGLRRTRQMMVQEVERSVNTIQTLDDSNVTMRRAKDEYEGQRSLLNRTRHLLSSMKQGDNLDRLLLITGVFIFLFVCTYIFLKRIGILGVMRSIPPIFSTQGPISSSPPKHVQQPADFLYDL